MEVPLRRPGAQQIGMYVKAVRARDAHRSTLPRTTGYRGQEGTLLHAAGCAVHLAKPRERALLHVPGTVGARAPAAEETRHKTPEPAWRGTWFAEPAWRAWRHVANVETRGGTTAGLDACATTHYVRRVHGL